MRYRMLIATGIALCLAGANGIGCDGTSETASSRGDTAEASTIPAIATPTVRGYIAASWHDEIPQGDAGECPEGLNIVEADFYPKEYAAYNAFRESGGDRAKAIELLPPDACQEPLSQPDPGFKLLEGPAVVEGLNLDGFVSNEASAQGGSCAHTDFVGPDGTMGVDNQLWRLMGCVRAYRPNEQMERSHESNGNIKEGGFAILIEISDMDDPLNDDEVGVQILTGNSPAQMNANGGILENVSVTVHENPRYQNAVAKGKIIDGILTTEPVDVLIKTKQQTLDYEFYYRDAQIRAEMLPDGRIKGILAGYWDAKNFFTAMNDQKFGPTVHLGRIAAHTRGFMCAGLYNAIPRVADGHPDPETGECTSISMTQHFEAVPAFVIRPQLAMAE